MDETTRSWREHYSRVAKRMHDDGKDAEQILTELLASGEALFDVCGFMTEREAKEWIQSVIDAI